MIQGKLRADNIPLVPLIVGWGLEVQEIAALVDTGFSGELKVSPQTKADLGLTTTHVQPTLLADGQITQVEAALAYVALEGSLKEVSVLISPGYPAIGSGLLRRLGFQLVINFKAGEVNLEKAGE